MGSGEGTTGYEVVPPVRQCRKNIGARGSDPIIGGRLLLAIHLGGSDRNDSGLIGGKARVRSVFTGIRGDHEDTPIDCRPKEPSDQRIVRPGQAQIDDRDAETHGFIERRRKRKAVAHCSDGTEALRPTRPKRVELGIGCNSGNANPISKLSGDDAGDSRAVDVISRIAVIR